MSATEPRVLPYTEHRDWPVVADVRWQAERSMVAGWQVVKKAAGYKVCGVNRCGVGPDAQAQAEQIADRMNAEEATR